MEAPSLFEHGNHDRHTLLFLDSKTIPPGLKIRGDDDLGGHTRSIPYQDYFRQRTISKSGGQLRVGCVIVGRPAAFSLPVCTE
jgi:hypothetical protein